MSKKEIEELIAECDYMVTSHRVSKKTFRRLFTVVEQTISHEDAGRLLMETLGSAAAVRAWIEQHQALTETILNKWYMGARLYEQEKKGGRK